MSRQAVRVAWYRFRSTLPDRWGGYLALVLLLGFVGGLAMGAVAAARRTQSAFPAYLASTRPSDLTVLTGLSGRGRVAGSIRPSCTGSPACPTCGGSRATA